MDGTSESPRLPICVHTPPKYPVPIALIIAVFCDAVLAFSWDLQGSGNFGK